VYGLLVDLDFYALLINFSILGFCHYMVHSCLLDFWYPLVNSQLMGFLTKDYYGSFGCIGFLYNVD